MSMKITYLNNITNIKFPNRIDSILEKLDEFMKVDHAVMRVDFSNHYCSPKSGRNAWYRAVKKSGYNLGMSLCSAENCCYIFKKSSIKETDT